ncbi:ABC transporter substrate-binding protein [Leucobacter sp. cx-42]|uniref:ABC transporter substrate-binding protein n=1 Tax=unclassified Leucobacter TaxID=2621730 RepID=UPI00165EA000|nr:MULTISPECIES: ABC transporter substrate-binding protein [unclassified Leucobacter]MBC9955163.1 ABC transporter substrate-binding protein [Leucobacter sp. cx-42]
MRSLPSISRDRHRGRGRALRGAAVAGTIVAALALTACGSTGGSDDAAPADSGKTLDSVTVGFPGSLSNLSITQEAGILNYNLNATVQEGLVGISTSGEIVPALASEWTTPDDTTYVFTLRPDAKFANGDPVTPADVVFSLNNAADPAASPGTNYYLASLASAEVTGDNEVTIKTKAPEAAFLANLSSAGALVVTQEKFAQEHGNKLGTSTSLLLGTGPYQVTEFSPDSHALLTPNENWAGEPVKAKEIRVDFISDENTRLLAAQKGDLDIALNVPLTQVAQWEKIDGGRVEALNDFSYVGLQFDQSVAPFDDPNVRAAIASAADRDAIVEKLLRGYGEPANTIMSPETLSQAYSPEEAREILSKVKANSFDLKQAAEFLKESSVPEGFTTELTYPNTGQQLGTAAQSLAENLKTIGITVKVREVPIEEWLATVGDGEHGLGFMWYLPTTGNPAEINSYLLGTDNPNHFESDEAVKLIAEASAETDPKKQIDLLVQLEELNAAETATSPLWWGQSLTYFSGNVGLTDFSPYSFIGPWGAELYAAE